MKNSCLKHQVFSYLLVSMYCIFAFTGCGSSPDSASSSVPSISMQELEKKIETTAGMLPDMTCFSSYDEDAEEWFSYLCDLDYFKVDNFFISYASEGTAEEIFLIKLKNASDVETAVESLQKRIYTRAKTFEMYLPKEAAKFSSAIVVSKGTYVALLICPDTANAKMTFETSI